MYEVSGHVVWMIYYQSIFWLSLAFFPYIAVIMPLFMLMLFKYSYFSLQKFYVRPGSSSNTYQTGYFIMILMTITFVLVAGFYSCLLYIPMEHSTWSSNSSRSCGPFTSKTYYMAQIDTLIDSVGWQL